MFLEVGDVEHPQAAVRPAAAALHLLVVVRVVLLVDGHGDLPAVDRRRHRHEGVRRLGERRVVVVFADRARLADVGDVDHAQPRVPAAGPQHVAEAQRVVQAVALPGHGGFSPPATCCPGIHQRDTSCGFAGLRMS